MCAKDKEKCRKEWFMYDFDTKKSMDLMNSVAFSWLVILDKSALKYCKPLKYSLLDGMNNVQALRFYCYSFFFES